MPVSRRNGLYVVEDAADFASVDRALAGIDDRLFLTWELDAGRKVYRVMCEYAAGQAAMLCEWRNEYREPLPLSHGLVEQVKSQRPRSGDFDPAAIQRANDEHARRRELELDEAMLEIADDVGPRISDKRSAVLPRGQHLRRARARTGHHNRKDLS